MCSTHAHHSESAYLLCHINMIGVHPTHHNELHHVQVLLKWSLLHVGIISAIGTLTKHVYGWQAAIKNQCAIRCTITVSYREEIKPTSTA